MSARLLRGEGTSGGKEAAGGLGGRPSPASVGVGMEEDAPSAEGWSVGGGAGEKRSSASVWCSQTVTGAAHAQSPFARSAAGDGGVICRCEPP